MAWARARMLQIGIDLPSEDVRNRLSQLLRERKVHGLQQYHLVFDDTQAQGIAVSGATPISIKELLTNWPKTMTERLNRALVNLAELSVKPGSTVRLGTDDETVVFATDKEEAFFYIKNALEGNGLVSATHSSSGFSVILTAHGWQQVEEWTRFKSSPEHPVFVAMWFGKTEPKKSEMTALYLEGIEPGVKQAGYRAKRVDMEEYNDYVMDKVLGMIRVAPFLVADYTGNRNGVYYEAGFAKGLGLPVINCCKAEDFSKTHFDIKQLNHILWKSPEDLRERLEQRIRGSIGEGPYTTENASPNE